MKDKIIGPLRQDYRLFEARGAGRADSIEKKHLTLARKI